LSYKQDLGDRFETILSGMKSLSKAISPLSALTVQFNLDTDIPAYADIFEANQKFALSYGKNFDAIPIVFRSVSIDYSPSMHTGKGVLSAEAPQGSVVQIVGPHDSGKGVLLKQLCDIHPTQPGQVLHSPHLQVLQVPHEPLFLESGGVFSNLHLPMVGQKAFNQKIMQRGRRILRRLGLNKPWIMEEYLCEEGKSPEPEAEDWGLMVGTHNTTGENRTHFHYHLRDSDGFAVCGLLFAFEAFAKEFSFCSKLHHKLSIVT